MYTKLTEAFQCCGCCCLTATLFVVDFFTCYGILSRCDIAPDAPADLHCQYMDALMPTHPWMSRAVPSDSSKSV